MSAGTLLSAGPELVRPGSRVRVHDDDGETEFVIVDPNEADCSAGRISTESPLGRAVLGHCVGDRVVVGAPAGRRTVCVVAILAASSETGL